MTDQGRELADLRARLDAAIAAIPELAGAAPGRALAQGGGRAVFAGRLHGKDVVFKIGPPTRWQAERVARQDTALRHFAAALAGRAGLAVPRALGAWPAHGLAVMSYAPGASLEAVLATAPDAERARLITRAGAWLAAATAPHRADDRFGGGYWVKRLGAEAAALPDPSARRLALALAARLADEAQACEGLVLARAPAHGDFRAANMLHDPAGDVLTVLDCDEWEVRPLSRELATFLADLAWREPGADAAADRAALVEGAGLPAAERATALPFFLTREVLHRLILSSAAGRPPASRRAAAERHLALDR
jgi:hypothetical protein